MKITFLTTQQAYWGGSEELWVRVAELAITKKYEVQVVVFSQENGLHPSLQKLEKAADSFLELQNTSKQVSLYGRLSNFVKEKILPQTLNEVKKFAPDYIIVSQANNFDAAFYQVINGFLLSYNNPFFLISQFNFEHACLSYNDIEKARKIFEKAEKIFFVSIRNKKVSERQLAKKILNAVFIDNPLNLTDVSSIAYPDDTQTIYFASVARFEVNMKGQDILLQVLSEDKWRERDWHLNIYGTGHDERYLKDLCAFYNLKNRITFHGQVTDIREVWKYNHALLMPSIAEGKPLALEEAMICGRIGIVSDVAGNTELVEDGVSGYIASSFFPGPFDDALEKAWQEKHLWNKMGVNAHNKMLKDLDLRPQETVLRVIEDAR